MQAISRPVGVHKDPRGRRDTSQAVIALNRGIGRSELVHIAGQPSADVASLGRLMLGAPQWNVGNAEYVSPPDGADVLKDYSPAVVAAFRKMELKPVYRKLAYGHYGSRNIKWGLANASFGSGNITPGQWGHLYITRDVIKGTRAATNILTFQKPRYVYLTRKSKTNFTGLCCIQSKYILNQDLERAKLYKMKPLLVCCAPEVMGTALKDRELEKEVRRLRKACLDTRLLEHHTLDDAVRHFEAMLEGHAWWLSFMETDAFNKLKKVAATEWTKAVLSKSKL